MKKLQKGFTLIELIMSLYIVIVIAGVVGWVMNILWVIKHIDDTITALVILHWVGIPVVPLGAILGLFF